MIPNFFFWDGMKTKKVVGLNWDFGDYSSIRNIPLKYPEGVYIYGDARNAPLAPPAADNVKGYFLWYNKENFIGRDFMHLFNGLNSELIFEIYHTDEIIPSYEKAHLCVIAGYTGRISLVLENLALMNKKIFRELDATDFNVICKTPSNPNYQNKPNKLVDECAIRLFR